MERLVKEAKPGSKRTVSRKAATVGSDEYAERSGLFRKRHVSLANKVRGIRCKTDKTGCYYLAKSHQILPSTY